MFLSILFRFQDSTHPEQLCLARWTMSLLTAPPLPKYQSTFDIVPVLAYVQSLPTANISLQLLSFKTLFLTVYSSISRVSSVARLGPSLQEHRDSVVLHFIFLGKTGENRQHKGIPTDSQFWRGPGTLSGQSSRHLF